MPPVTRRRITKPALLVSAGAACLLSLPNGPSALGAPRTAPTPAAASAAQVNPAARNAIARMVKAYRELRSFSGSVEVRGVGVPDAPSVRATFSFRRPNRAAITCTDARGTTRAVTDGSHLFSTVPTDPTTYSKQAAPAGEAAIQHTFLQGGLGRTGGFLPLLAGQDPLAPLSRSLRSLKAGPPGTVAGVAVETVVASLDSPEGPVTMTFSIGKGDHLLRQLTVSRVRDNRPVLVTQTHTAVKANPEFGDAAFSFTPPPRAQAVGSLQADLITGGDALPLSGEDWDGKPLSLSQYQDKVLLLNFWATSCTPCMEEVPSILAAHAAYKANGLEIINVSLDRAEDKKLVFDFLRESRLPGRLVYEGAGPETPIALRYGVRSLPFTVVIGRTGKVAALGARGSALEDAVRQAVDSPAGAAGDPLRMLSQDPASPHGRAPGAGLLPTPRPGGSTDYVPPGHGEASPGAAGSLEVLATGGVTAVSAQRGQYAFGEVSRVDRREIEHVFTLKNRGTAPVTLQRLHSTCGCASALVQKGGAATAGGLPTLAPGEEASVRVAIDLAQVPSGPLRKFVSVYAAGSTQPVARLEVAGTVTSDVTFSPEILDFGRAEAGKDHAFTLTATVDARLAADGSLPPLVSTNPEVRIAPAAAEEGGEPRLSADGKTVTRRYTLTLAPGTSLGTITGVVSFAPTLASGPTAPPAGGVPAHLFAAWRSAGAPLVGQVVGDVSAQPQVLALDVSTSDAAAARQITLTGKTADALQDLTITSNTPWLAARLAPAATAASPTRTLDVSLSAEAPKGVLQAELTVTLKNGQRLLIPVSAYVKP